MYRTNINKLRKWRILPNRKPLVLLGARQVGKTWLLQEFGKSEYKQIAYINFEHANAPKGIFEMDFDIDRLITILNAYCKLNITPDDTIIIFDEIQEAPKGITALKYFYENAPEYHVVAAGSLLGLNIHTGESFPVGKVDFLKLFPMSFFEFLLAMNEEGIAKLIEQKDFDSLSFFHHKLLNYLRYYLYIGGMPEVVNNFVKNRDWQMVRTIQNQILTSYQKDFSKHAPKEILPRINMVWESIPVQLSKENKKFLYGVIKEGSRAKDYEIAIQWLIDAGLLHKVNNVAKPALPLAAYKELSAFKLYHNDVGLLSAMSRLSSKTIVDGNEVFTEFKGALTEQFVFQQLVQNEGLSIHYFTFENSKYEIDFLLQTPDDNIIPVEVKSGENLRAKSFNRFYQKYKPQNAIRTSSNPYKQEDWLINLPLYAIGVID
ncbi:ATP-binding protein [Paludibacter sp.]